MDFRYHGAMAKRYERNATVLGILAIALWSTSVAFTRKVAEHTGTLNMAFFNMLCAGLFLFLLLLLIPRMNFFSKLKNLPKSYYYKAGSFLVMYMVFFYIAVGHADSREAVIVIGIINYLWPGLSFLFGACLLKKRTRYGLLIPGIILAFGGTFVAILKGYGLTLKDIAGAFSGNLVPYLFAFIAAVCWAIYSNLTGEFEDKDDIVALPVLFMVSALVILVIQLLIGETPRLVLSGVQYLEFAYFFIFPTALGYQFWDIAMKQKVRKKKDLVKALSYLIPLPSTLITGYYLKVEIGLWFWLAAILVAVGAFLSWLSGE